MADPKDETELSIQWTKKTKAFVKGVNDFVERGLRDGWENAGSEPEEDGSRAALAVAVLDAVRRANEADNVNGLRQRFPPAHAPFVAMLDDVAQSVGPVLFLEDGAVVARLGAPYEEGSVVIVRGDDVETLDGIQMFGRSHDRAVFAYVTAEGFKTTQGWDGRVIARFQRPTGNKGFPEDLVEQAGDWDPIVETLIPFNDGKRLVVVGPGGVFLLTESSASRLFPRPESIRELGHSLGHQVSTCRPHKANRNVRLASSKIADVHTVHKANTKLWMSSQQLLQRGHQPVDSNGLCQCDPDRPCHFA